MNFKFISILWIEGWKRFSGKSSFNPKYQLTQMWINRMRAKEYNPIHMHPPLSFIFCVMAGSSSANA